jgi:hypothetical protein
MRNILKLLTLSAVAASVAGCAYGGVGGLGYNSGYGYDGYGYSPYGYGGSGVSVSLGYGSGYGYSPYGYGYGYGYGSPYYAGYYGSPYFGWYNNCYYPGSGIYVYDSNRQPRVWSNAERTYWTGRRQAYQAAAIKQGQQAPRIDTNWSEFRRDRVANRADTRADTRAVASNRIDRVRSDARQTRETARSVRSDRVQRTDRVQRAERTPRTERSRDRRVRGSDD